MSYVHKKERVNHPTCILCERCVSACPEDVLRIADKIPKKEKQ